MTVPDKGGHGQSTMHPQQMTMSAITEASLTQSDKIKDDKSREFTVGDVTQIGDRFLVTLSRTR